MKIRNSILGLVAFSVVTSGSVFASASSHSDDYSPQDSADWTAAYTTDEAEYREYHEEKYGTSESSFTTLKNYLSESFSKKYNYYFNYDEYLLDEAVCKNPETIFQYDRFSTTAGLVKIQIVCNVINVYVEDSTEAHRTLFGTFTPGIYPYIIFSPGLLSREYSDASYGTIHRPDDEHKQKHRSREETKITHSHILHKTKAKIELEDIMKFTTMLKKNNLISKEKAEDIVHEFLHF